MKLNRATRLLMAGGFPLIMACILMIAQTCLAGPYTETNITANGTAQLTHHVQAHTHQSPVYEYHEQDSEKFKIWKDQTTGKVTIQGNLHPREQHKNATVPGSDGQ